MNLEIKKQIIKKISNLSDASHNEISVNDGLHIQWWSHKIIMELKNCYHLENSYQSCYNIVAQDSTHVLVVMLV